MSAANYDYTLLDNKGELISGKATYYCRDYLLPDVGNALFEMHKHDKLSKSEVTLVIKAYNFPIVDNSAYNKTILELVKWSACASIEVKEDGVYVTLTHSENTYCSYTMSFVLFMITRAKYLNVDEIWSNTKKCTYEKLLEIARFLATRPSGSNYFGTSSLAQTFIQAYGLWRYAERYSGHQSSNYPNFWQANVLTGSIQYGEGSVYYFNRDIRLHPSIFWRFLKDLDLLKVYTDQIDGYCNVPIKLLVDYYSNKNNY